MIEQYAQPVVNFLQTHPHWGGLITFLIAFLESIAVIGTIVPGSVTMTAVGMLIGTAILPFGMTLFWATVGAFLGDLLGYWIGSYYNERLRKMWPFKKHPEWLAAGESFFHRHGGKSILIGRFIGPLRSLIPMTAGLLHMPFRRFVIAALPAACLWALAYMLPGILLGAVSLQLPHDVATKFIFILVLLIVLLTFFAWLITYFSYRLKQKVIKLLKKMWGYLQSHKSFSWFTKLIANQDNPDDFRQLGWFILAIITFAIFITVYVSVIQHTHLITFNRPILEFLRSIRNAKTDHIMVGITLLGDGRVLSICAAFIFIWLYAHKNRYAAIHWAIAFAIGLITPNAFKFLLFFPRPTGFLHVFTTSSFPSGHTFLSLIYYGFLATLIGTHIRKIYRRFLYYFVTCIVLLIGFSRLYLGVHWLTDILASLSLGFTFLALITLSYRRRNLPINVPSFSLFAFITTLVIWSIYSAITFEKNLNHYTLNWPSQIIEQNAWWGETNPVLPIYRENRLGQPAEPMNLQFSGDITKLKEILITQGWTAKPNMTLLKNTIQKLSQTQTGMTTFLPSLYLNNPPVLYLVKDNSKSKLILKLWKSNVYLSRSWDAIFTGNIVEYEINKRKKKIIYSYNVVEKLIPYLNANGWETKIVPTAKIPSSLFQKNWDGHILQMTTPASY